MVGTRFVAAGLFLPAVPLLVDCGGRLQEQFDGGLPAIDAAAEAADDAPTSPEASLEAQSGLKCHGGDCGNESCCAWVTFAADNPTTISSATSACSASRCEMGQYQLCASDSECFEAGCIQNPFGPSKFCNRACTPGTLQCSNSSPIGVQTCEPNFQWGSAAPCSGDTPACLDGGCVACDPRTSRCAGGEVQTCDPTTGQWAATTPCSPGTRCIAGACL